MNIRLSIFLALIAGRLVSSAPGQTATEAFEFRDGDRVVLVGDTLIEREQSYGYVETRLYQHFPDRKFIVRNLGWSGDTPAGESRASFDFADSNKGWERLETQLTAVKPTVAVIGYGMASSFAGQEGLPKFTNDLNRLIDSIEKISGKEGVRFVLLSPVRHEQLPPPMPDPSAHNQQLVLYSAAIRDIAKGRGARFISLIEPLDSGGGGRLTDNGIHLTASGYARLADSIERGLGWKPVAPANSTEQTERLREAIVKKNELFFYRWRPQNETYLFGFRKQEQGRNAREIPMFDPLVQAEEEKIFELRKPQAVDPRDRANSGTERKSEKVQATRPSQPVPEFDVAPGFEVNLFAENPQLAKPIQMNFDPQGRLWIASSSVYPQIQPGQEANDKILVVEDTDGDGKADRSTVFAEGLLIPTGVAPGDGGVYVGQSTELLHFKDTDGDGKADQRRVVLSGFGTEDTHHILHTLRWGPDGQLYFNQSIYIHSHLETPHGVVRANSGAVFNLRPATMQLEIFLKGFCNPWGHDFDEFGQSFVTDGAGFQGISYGVRGATYFTYASMRREMKSVSAGNYPKFCGLEIVSSPQFPPEWQGSFVTCDFRAHRVVHFGVTEQGAGYATKEMPDLLRTTNVTFRPIDVKFGPDGALYIADWSNPIIQHGEVDFRDPRRDHEHGRIWRVTAKGKPLAPRRNFVEAPTSELLQELASTHGFARQQARRVLAERGTKIEGDLRAWSEKQDAEKTKLEALWMFQAIDRPEPALLETLLKAGDPHVRAAAVRVLSFWIQRLPNAEQLLAARVQDEHPRVRLEAIRVLGRIPTARSADLVLGALDKADDYFLEYAIWLSMNDLAGVWVDALQSGTWKSSGREKQLEYALQAIEPALASRVLTQLLKERPLPRDGSGPWIKLIGQTGNPQQLQMLFDEVLLGSQRNGFTEPARKAATEALLSAATLRNTRPSENLDRVTVMLASTDEIVRASGMALSAAWKIESAVPQMAQLAADENLSGGVRAPVVQALRQIGTPGAIRALRDLIAQTRKEVVRAKAAVALAQLDFENSSKDVVRVLSETADEGEATSLWRELLSIKNAGARLAKVLPRSGLPPAMVKNGLRVAREGNRKEPELIAALERNAPSDEPAGPSDSDIQRLAKETLQRGDPRRGETVYRRPELACVTCHAIGGAGGKVGPDFTSIGASAQPDYLVESVFYPNRKIKEGFHSIIVQTRDEQELSGLLLRETPQELILRDVTGKDISVAKNNIKSQALGASLMPSGLIDNLPEQERLDLFRFLSELGKPGPFDASKGGVARAWKLRAGTHTVEQFGEQDYLMGKFESPIWMTVLTHVDGRVERDQLKEALSGDKYSGIVAVYAATHVEASKGGLARFVLTVSAPAQLWIDGKAVAEIPAVKSGEGSASALEYRAELSAGRHAVVLKLDPKALPEALTLKSPDVAFVNE